MRGNARWDQSHCGQWRCCNIGRVGQRCTLQILCGCYCCGISHRNQRRTVYIRRGVVRGAANALAADGWTRVAVKALAVAISARSRISADVWTHGAVKALSAAISAGTRVSPRGVCLRRSKGIIRRNQREIARIRRGVCARGAVEVLSAAISAGPRVFPDGHAGALHCQSREGRSSSIAARIFSSARFSMRDTYERDMPSAWATSC